MARRNCAAEIQALPVSGAASASCAQRVVRGEAVMPVPRHATKPRFAPSKLHHHVVPALSRDPYRVICRLGIRWRTLALTTDAGGYGSLRSRGRRVEMSVVMVKTIVRFKPAQAQRASTHTHSRHGRACPGLPRLATFQVGKTDSATSSRSKASSPRPAMTQRDQNPSHPLTTKNPARGRVFTFAGNEPRLEVIVHAGAYDVILRAPSIADEKWQYQSG
jgi:hypothetical protein